MEEYMDLAVNIATLISGSMDIILFIIAIYTFYLTFISNNISLLTFGLSFSMWENDSMNFTLKNKSLKTIVISKINIVFDNKYSYNIENYDTPMVVSPLSTICIKTKPYTSLSPKSTLTEYHNNQAFFHLEIITDENKKIYTKIKNIKKYKINKKAKHEEVSTFTSKFNNIVTLRNYKYAISYRYNGSTELKTAFINNLGAISTNDFGFNAIPKEYLNNITNVNKCFEEASKQFGITYWIKSLEL